MRRSIPKAAALTATFAGLVSAAPAVENYTICNWGQLRTGVIRDTVYLDGGEMWWQTAFVDGTQPVVSNDGNVEGDMYLLNFSVPFDTTKTNLSALFTPKSKAGGAANNIAPNYVDGTIFANDDELYLYGGLIRLTNASTPPDADSVLGYEAYQYGPYRSTWSPGFEEGQLSANVTRYVTNGAGVNIPSENLGFYFSGMRAADWGPIDYDDGSADTPANTLIGVDMSVMRGEKYSNITLPDSIPPRANAELVWIPVSTQGVLVAIGGVYPPEELFAGGLNDSQTSDSKSQSPGFMTSLPIYDIATQTWHTQKTTGDAPGQLTEFCSVVATASDSSSFNVYMYGGYDGLNPEDSPSDDVWILSIPSFNWIKAYTGTSGHGRSSHKCVKPYPDQMFIIGGLHQDPTQCVTPIQVFNLNNLQFQNTYSPTQWSDYKVPDVVTKVIGGTAEGGSTLTATWSDNVLGNLFGTKYTKNITSWYPYTPTNAPPSSTSGGGGSHGLASWVAPVLGVILGLIVLSLIVVAFLLWRRRKLLRRHSMDGSSITGSNTNRIMRWANGMPSGPDHKSDPSVTSTEVDETHVSSPLSGFAEVGGQQRYEMQAMERERPPVEMATPYHFQDHPRYPRSIDYAYGPQPGQPHSPGYELHSETSPGVPSPIVLPQRPGEGSSRMPSELASVPGSPSSASPAQSPQLTHSDPSEPDEQPSKFGHTRNISSLSSGVNQLPSPSHTVSPDEEKRRSAFISGLPSSPDTVRSQALSRVESPALVSPESPRKEQIPAVKRKAAKKSSFGEILDDGTEEKL